MAAAAGQQVSMLAGAVRHSCGLYWDALHGWQAATGSCWADAAVPLSKTRRMLIYKWHYTSPDTPPDMGVLYSALREAPAAEQHQA